MSTPINESTTEPAVGESELVALWHAHVEAESLLLESIKARQDGRPLIEQVHLLDHAAVALSDNRAALQKYRNSIIVPE